MAVATPTKKRRAAARKPAAEDLASRTRRTFKLLPPDVQDLVRQAAGQPKANGRAKTPQISADLVKKMAPSIQETLRKATTAALSGPRFAADTETGGGASVSAADTSITKQLTEGGPAFGDFIKSVGLGAAAAQAALDKDLVETAKVLSDTQIDVIAIFEQLIDDNDGSMLKGNPVKQKLPLINYLMPTAYQWSRIFLQADMKVSRFSAESGFNIQAKSQYATVGGQIGYSMFGGFSGSADARYTNSSSQVSGGTAVAQDQSAGSLHMEATLEPRPDIKLPQPFVIQKGPKLKLTAGNRTDLTRPNADTTKPPDVIGKQVVVTALLTKTDGNVLDGKLLDVSVSEPLLDVVSTPTDGKTAGGGQVAYAIKRQGAAWDPAKPMSATVRVSFGLINQTVGITL